MDENGMNNTDFQDQQRFNEFNAEQDRLNASRDNADREPAKVSLRIGDGDTDDMWKNNSYQEKLTPEIDAVVDALSAIGGGNALLPIEEKVAAGETRAEATRDVVRDYLDGLGNTEIDADKISDLIIDSLQEKGYSLEEIAEGGIDKLKEALNDISLSENENIELDKAISDKIDNLSEALDALESKIDSVKAASDSMNKKIDNLSRFDMLTPRNTFKQWAVLSIKMQARADGIPINGHVPKASEMFIGVMNSFRSNIIESLIELALVKIIDKIEEAQDKVDNGTEKGQKPEGPIGDVDKMDKPDTPDTPDKETTPDKLEVNKEGMSDNGTVTKRMDSTDIKNSIECNPAYGAVAGCQLRSSDATISYTDRNGVTRENTGDTIQYRIMGSAEKGSPVVGKIVVDMETGAKSIIAADRTVVAVFGTDKPEHSVGDKVSSSEVDVRLNQNKVESFTEDKFGTRDVTVSVKNAVVENYAKAVDTYVGVAQKEAACLSEQKAEITANRDFLESKYEAMSDKEKSSDFGKEVKEKIDTCESQIEKIDARIEKIGEFTDKAESFKESYKDFKDGKSDVDTAFDKAISAEDSAVSRGAKFTTDGSKDDWKNGRMFDGVSALDEKDTKEFDDICDFVDNYDDIETYENIDTEEQGENGDISSEETDEKPDEIDGSEAETEEHADEIEQDTEVPDKDGADNVEATEEENPDKTTEDNADADTQKEDASKDEDDNSDKDDSVDAEETDEESDSAEKTEDDKEDTPQDVEEDKGDNETVSDDETAEAVDEEENDTDTAEEEPEDTEKAEEEAEEVDTSDVEQETEDGEKDATDVSDTEEKGNDTEADNEEANDKSSTDEDDAIDDEEAVEESVSSDETGNESVDENADPADSSDTDSNGDTDTAEEDTEGQTAIDNDSREYNDEEIIEGVDGETTDEEMVLTAEDREALSAATETLPTDFIDNEVSYDNDEPEDTPVERENYFENEVPTSLKDGLEKVNDDSEHYSFEDFVDLYKDVLSEPNGDERLIDAYCDLVEEKGIEGISPDLTYSLAYYDEDGFCKGIDKIDEALADRDVPDDVRASIIDNAVDSYCKDPIADLSIDNGYIEFEIPISKDKTIDVDGDRFEIHRGDTVHYSIDLDNGNVISDVSSDKTGNFYVPVEGNREDVIPFVCDVLGDIYGKQIGEIAKDVAQLVEREYPNDKEYILDKICDHIGDFIEARHTEPWEIADVEINIADTIKGELDELANDVAALEEDSPGFDIEYEDEDDYVDISENIVGKDDDDDDNLGDVD